MPEGHHSFPGIFAHFFLHCRYIFIATAKIQHYLPRFQDFPPRRARLKITGGKYSLYAHKSAVLAYQIQLIRTRISCITIRTSCISAQKYSSLFFDWGLMAG